MCFLDSNVVVPNYIFTKGLFFFSWICEPLVEGFCGKNTCVFVLLVVFSVGR